MKILFITRWYPVRDHTYDGIFVREYAKAVRAGGNEVFVLHVAGVSSKSGGLWQFAEEVDPELTEGIPTFRVSHRSIPIRGMTYPIYVWSAVRAYRRLCALGFEPDVIHAHVYDAGVPAVVIGKRFGIPVVVTEHFSGFARRTLNRAAVRKARYAFENADRTLPVSTYLQRTIAAYGIEANFEVVPNVVDTSLFFTAIRKSKTDEKRMIFVGNLEPSEYKGYPNLLEALTLLGGRRRDWRLDVIGKGPKRVEYERRTKSAGLPAPVAFHGAKPKREIAEMMRDSDLFVLPSKSETFGCVLAEALVSGLPIVSTSVGNVPNLVPSSAGILVAPDDPPALADALDTMLSDLDSYDRDAIAADACSQYSYEAVGRKLQAVYLSVLSESGKDARAATYSAAES
jgi:glycosyltransferase involved in cell wall biosynthesis